MSKKNSFTEIKYDAVFRKLHHDFTSSLGNISSFLEIMNEEYHGEIDEKFNRYLSYMQRACLKAKKSMEIVTHLYEVQINPKAIKKNSLDAILENCISSDLKILLSQKSGNIRKKTELGLLNSDKNLMQILFFQLISNGLLFNTSSNPLVEVDLESTDSKYLLIFTDNGIGYSDDQVNSLPANNVKLHPKSNGIGLSICKKIMALHNGKLFVNDQTTQGAEIICEFPLG